MAKSHIQRIILNIFSIKALLLSLKKLGLKISNVKVGHSLEYDRLKLRQLSNKKAFSIQSTF
jgi:hypothetical protein